MTPSDGRYAGLLHLIALANILKVKVRSIYPDVFPNILRPMLNVTISPMVERAGSQNRCVSILWCHTSWPRLDANPLHWKLNHFVPLLPAGPSKDAHSGQSKSSGSPPAKRISLLPRLLVYSAAAV